MFFFSTEISGKQISRSFDHFYFYNSFYENLATAQKIDDECSIRSACITSIQMSFTANSRKGLPVRRVDITKVHGLNRLLYPPGYLHAGSDIHDMLQYWVKE